MNVCDGLNVEGGGGGGRGGRVHAREKVSGSYNVRGLCGCKRLTKIII